MSAADQIIYYGPAEAMEAEVGTPVIDGFAFSAQAFNSEGPFSAEYFKTGKEAREHARSWTGEGFSLCRVA